MLSRFISLLTKTLAGLALATGLVGCVTGPAADDRSVETGAARVEIKLGHIAALAKKNDTLVQLDSVNVELSSPGCRTRAFKLAVTGSLNAGSSTVSAEIADLAALRNWKAKVWSKDAADSILHMDSVTFFVAPGRTAEPSLSLIPKYSVLVARFVSTSKKKVVAIEKLELFVNGKLVDDTTFAKKLDVFDVKLSTKYLKSGSASTIELRAISNVKRYVVKYSKLLNLTANASEDTETTVNLVKGLDDGDDRDDEGDEDDEDDD